MSKKDLLKEKAKGKLATAPRSETASETQLVPAVSELYKITREIKSNLDEMQDIYEWWNEKKDRVNELKESIITSLIYVRDHKKDLLPDRTFESYLTEDIGISKGYFYEQLQAYNLCLEYKQPGLFREVDHKVLVGIAREKDPAKQKELVARAPQLSREFFKKDKRAIRGSEQAYQAVTSALVNREMLSIKVSDSRILEALEVFLRENGIVVEYM